MKPTIITPLTNVPLPAIRLGQADGLDGATPYATWLVWFMRVLALLWMGQGLSNWGLLMLGDAGGQGIIDTMSDTGAAAVIFFAVLDLIAAVGLWLAASWGGVVWLVAIAAQWLALVLLPGFFSFDVPIGIADAVLVITYFVLTYRAASESAQ